MNKTDFVINALTLQKLKSNDFIIQTKAIKELDQKLEDLLARGACGAIVVSRTRVGKTCGAIYVKKRFQECYGEDFPVIMWDVTDHAVTQKNFYSTLLTAMGVPHKTNSTALTLRERTLNELVLRANNTIFHKVVIMIDEAWRFAENDFSWLMDLYNVLRRSDIQLTCFMFGTWELRELKETFKRNGKNQIVERFMNNEYQFFGIRESAELGLCLFALDNVNTVNPEGEGDSLKEFYFPNAGRNDTFYSLMDDYWKAFQNIKIKYGITAPDIPMEYVMESFKILLTSYGKLSISAVVFPSYQEIYDSILATNYTESCDEYNPK